MQQKMDYLGGVQDISFHVKQDAVSESGFSERLARCSEISSARAVAFRRLNRGSSFYGGGVIKQR